MTSVVGNVLGPVAGNVLGVPPAYALTPGDVTDGKQYIDADGVPRVGTAPATLTPQQLQAAITAALAAQAGGGAYPVVVSVADASTGQPIQQADVRATAPGLSPGSGKTDTGGQITLSLDGGVYSVTATASGYVGSTIAANVSSPGQVVGVTLAALVVPLPVNPQAVIGTITKTDGSGGAKPGAVFTFQLIATPAAGNVSGSTIPFPSDPTDAGGHAHVEFVPGWTYRAWAGAVVPATAGRGVDFIAPTTDFAVPAILGR